MRVIAGSAKRRLLKYPTGWTGRPTADRVKEALFNILGDLVINCRFLDVFAGVGGIGVEALSRGADSAVFVENDRNAAMAVLHNLKLTGFNGAARVIILDVYKAMAELYKKKEVFDIIFLDPPYDQGLEVPVIEKVLEFNLISPGGLIIAESSKRVRMPEEIKGCHKARKERYGDTVISFYRG